MMGRARLAAMNPNLNFFKVFLLRIELARRIVPE
jgi:hypothetical protein